jgi:hypothetical protein
MPRYYFDLVDRDGEHVDEDGVECGDLDEAIMIARRTISEIALDLFCDTDQKEVAMRIRDGVEGPVLLRVTLDTFG